MWCHIFSISSHFSFNTIPFYNGYSNVRTPFLAIASSPTKFPLPSAPGIYSNLEWPTTVGNTVLGASSPASPALIYPVPLSITTAGFTSYIIKK